MPSVLRERQLEWNHLVPIAHARGIRIRPHNALPESIAYIEGRLQWLRTQLGEFAQTETRAPTPTDDLINTFTFGVEIEFILPSSLTHDALASLITEAGVLCRRTGYNHLLASYWKIVSDGSLLDYSRGAEIVSPPLQGDAGFEQLRKVCAVLKQRKCKINTRCGFHVHIGARDRDVSFFRNLVLMYANFEEALDSIMPHSRRQSNNNYCRQLSINRQQLLRARTINQVARACNQHDTLANARSWNRQRKLNLQSFWQHGTVEIRHHSGTIEALKAENWVRLCLRMAAHAVQMTEVPDGNNTLEHLLERLQVTQIERAYFLARAASFATTTPAQALRRA